MARYKFDQIAFNNTDKKKPVDEDKEHYIGLEHLDSGSLKVTRWGSEIAPKGEKLLMKKGDVLFGKRRAYQKKVAIAPFDGIFSAHGLVLRPKTDVIDPGFFPLFIASDYFLDAAIKISVGSLSPTINWRDLKELEFDLPSISVQQKLARVLWAINDTKEAYQKLIQETDELVKSQFIEMFGDPKNAAAKPGMVKGEMLFSLASGKANTIENLNDQYPYECYGGNGITGNSKNYLVKDPTIVIGRVGEYCGSVHMTSPFSWITDNAIYITDYDEKTINLEFLYRECQVMDFHRFAATVGQPKITQKPLLESFYIVPTMERQNQYVDIAEQSDKSKFELQYVKRNVKEMIKCSQKKIRLNR